MATPVRLAVDLGTTHTVAIVARGDQRPRPLLFDGSPLLPSGVFLDAAGVLHTGRDAQRLAGADPARYEPHPKRRIDDGSILLGDREVPVERLLSTALRRVADEAAGSGLRPTDVIITHPADWGPVRRSIVERAAADAGLGEVALLPEPVAAAAYCTRELDDELPEGGAVAVFDFGGGTLDVAVLRRGADDGDWRPVAVGGLDDLGGLDIDDLLVAHLGRLVAHSGSDVWRRIERPETAADRRDRLAFWTEVRAAKEMLSRASTAPVTVPGEGEVGLHLTRDELGSLAAPLIARAVDETRRTLERAGVEPSELAALLLVGGSSRMPQVATRLHSRLGVMPSVPEQPELPVAYGALVHRIAEAERAAAAPEGPTPYAPQPAEWPELGPVRLPAPEQVAPEQAPPAAPAEPAAASSPPEPEPAEPSPPESSPPAAESTPPAAAPTPPEPTPPAAESSPQRPAFSPPARGVPGPPPVGPSHRSGRGAGVAIGTIVLFVVVALIIALQSVNWGDLFSGLGDDDPAGTIGELDDPIGEAVPGGAEADGDAEATGLEERFAQTLESSGAAAVAVTAELAFIAEVGLEQTTITARNVSDGAEVWSGEYGFEPTDLRLTVVEDLLVVDAAASATDGGEDVRAAIALADGELLWERQWNDERIDVAYFGTHALIEQRDGIYDNAVLRVDLSTGEEQWSRGGPDGLFIIDETRIRAATYWDDGEDGEATGTPAPHYDSPNLHDSLVAGDRVVDLDPDAGEGAVLDAASGEVVTSGELPLDGDFWTVYEDMAVGRLSDDASPGRDVLAAYSLSDLELAWETKLAAGYAIANVKPCAPTLVCAEINDSGSTEGYETAAFDIATGEKTWWNPVDWATEDNWYTTPAGIVFGDHVFDTISYPEFWDLDGNAQTWAYHSVAAIRDGRVAVLSADAGSGSLVWKVVAADLVADRWTPGAEVGTSVPEQVVVAGDAVAVLTADRRALVFAATGLG
ncbi:MAG TPA: Hsp70 family protein [Glycomyces sp.]|nr:Hsp70 family protein [Glycomyces sp.]